MLRFWRCGNSLVQADSRPKFREGSTELSALQVIICNILGDVLADVVCSTGIGIVLVDVRSSVPLVPVLPDGLSLRRDLSAEVKQPVDV